MDTVAECQIITILIVLQFVGCQEVARGFSEPAFHTLVVRLKLFLEFSKRNSLQAALSLLGYSVQIQKVIIASKPGLHSSLFL